MIKAFSVAEKLEGYSCSCLTVNVKLQYKASDLLQKEIEYSARI